MLSKMVLAQVIQLKNHNMKKWTIYKITNPMGQVYIGKTSSFRDRMDRYRTIKKYERQRLIYESIKEFGFDNHVIEIIESFESDDIHAQGREIFWIRTFMSNFNKFPIQNGLNLTDGGAGALGCKYGEERALKLSKIHKGKTVSKESRERMRLARINSPYQNIQKPHTEETKAKLRNALTNNPKNTGSNHHSSKLVLNLETGIFYESMREAAKAINKNTNYLHSRLQGHLKNKTAFSLI